MDSQLQFAQILASRVQIWPCSLWRPQWWSQFEPSGCSELISLRHPDVILSAHRELLQAGTDALVTNTFGATRPVMAGYDVECRAKEANCESARLAFQAANGIPDNSMKIIVGSIGPTCRLVTLQHTSLESMTQVYFEQAHALWQGGVRVFYLDRCDDLQNAKAALIALAQFERETGAKVTKIVTAHVLENGRMLLGTSVMEIWAVLKDFNVQAFGVSGHFDAVELALMDVPDHLTVHLVALNFGG